MRTSARVASASRVDSSSTVSGRAALKSAASSSWASGVTGDHHRRERRGLSEADDAALGQLEQGQQGGEHVHDRGPRARALRASRTPPAGPAGPRYAGWRLRRRAAARPRGAAPGSGSPAITRSTACEQLEQVQRERRRRQLGRRREVAAGELLGPALGRAAHPDRDLADLLVLQQPPDQLGAGILPAVILRPAAARASAP